MLRFARAADERKPESEPELLPAAAFLCRMAALYAACGLFVAALTIAFARATPAEAAPSIGFVVAITTPIMLACSWRTVPLRRSLPEPPAGVPVVPFTVWPSAWRILPFLAAVVGLVELLHRVVDLNRAIAPGTLLGTGLGCLLMAGWTALWQLRHRRRVLLGEQDAETQLYATG